MQATTTALRPARLAVARRGLAGPLGLFLLSLLIGYWGFAILVADRCSTPEHHPVVGSPADYGLAYEPVRFYSAVDRVPLAGWYIDSPGSRVIIMLHGWNSNRNAGDTAMPLAQVLVAHNYDVLMFDLRGHGESGGARTSMGQFEIRDVAGAVEYLKGRGVTRIGAIGWSLGANTAINSAAELPELRAIIADSVWAELVPLLDSTLLRYTRVPFLYTPAVALAADSLYGIDIWNNRPARVLANIGDRPILLIHELGDTMIPVTEAYALQKAGANNPHLESWIVPGATHTRAYRARPQEFVERMLAFYDRYLQ